MPEATHDDFSIKTCDIQYLAHQSANKVGVYPVIQKKWQPFLAPATLNGGWRMKHEFTIIVIGAPYT